MTAPDVPDVTNLHEKELLALAQAVESRLGEVRAEFVERAAALGLAVVDGDGKKTRKRRPSMPKEND